MNRRETINLFGTATLLLFPSLIPLISSPIEVENVLEDFNEAFKTRWEGLKKHTIEVFSAMPNDNFHYRPTKDIMSFSELSSHIGEIKYKIAEEPKDIETEEPKEKDKDFLLMFLDSQFEKFSNIMGKLNQEELFKPKHNVNTIDGEIFFSDYDIIMLAYNHTTHHKGQATTYLRLQNIVPPQYQF